MHAERRTDRQTDTPFFKRRGWMDGWMPSSLAWPRDEVNKKKKRKKERHRQRGRKKERQIRDKKERTKKGNEKTNKTTPLIDQSISQSIKRQFNPLIPSPEFPPYPFLPLIAPFAENASRI
mmetsp:Transcript_39225/g.77169  ORF Transcript_39225/g.77169 Transcript_39225/m.77169 type:complete len:121 (+) Transcript_39225:4277-4639(+)